MKVINIITINDNSNYGNRLQSYALSKYLRNNNIKVNVLWIDSAKNYLKNYLKQYLPINKEIRRFNRFNKFTIYDIKVKRISSYNLSLDGYYMVGSDQVWNPTLKKFVNDYLLKGVSPEKRISYAASFGIDEIPKEYEKTFAEELKKFKSISVREDNGVNIIKKIANRNDVKIVIDPTMLLSSEEWSIVAKKPSMLKKQKFILCYFLGNLSIERKKIIERYANEKNCQIINILDKNDPFYECGPREFLYLEKNAYLICTDSYHSSVFAFIFNKPFLIYNRIDKLVNMNSRIDTFINKFGLEDRKYNEKEITDKVLEIHYDKAYKILKEERKKSNIFIIDSIKEKKSD